MASTTKTRPRRSAQLSIIPKDECAPFSTAERRQLTILFVDIIDSTRLSERIDPEEFFQIVCGYRAICDEKIRGYDGRIGNTVGDGLLAYFGLPQAHEDDPERAVHAALSIVAVLRGHRFPTSEAGPLQLNVRIAVNTGTVVVGKLTGGPRDHNEVFGSSLNIAARLQGVAPVNGVVIGADTYRLVRRAFCCTHLGEKRLKGVDRLVGAWRVDGVVEHENRFERTRTSPLTPMIGRDAECEILAQMWTRCTNGSGGAAVIFGDPGIGKSRLIKAFRASFGSAAVETLFLQCSPLHSNTPLAPEIERLRRAAGIRKGDGDEFRLVRLRSLLAAADADTADVVRYYGSLLSIASCNGYEPADLGSPHERERAFLIMTDVLIASSRKRPILMVVEDVQWIDPTSVELLQRILGRLCSARVLLLITHRSDFNPSWLRDLHACRILLRKLPIRESEHMVKAVAGDTLVPAELLAKIVSRTDGVPLFIEECTRAILDSGMLQRTDDRVCSGLLPEPLVPASIRDSLMERLDRLGQVKRIAQIASVFGRQFPYEGVQYLYRRSSESLLRGLELLENAGVIRRAREQREALFAFRHSLMQEAAYASLLKEERRELHARAASWLCQGSPIRESSQAAVLGYHYSGAGRTLDAIEAWLQAGKSALSRSATKEAVAHLRQGIALVSKLPASAQRFELEIALQSTLAMAYTAVAGWSDPNVYGAYSCALQLCRSYGTIREKSIVFWGIAVAKVVNCELAKCLHHAREFIRLAEQWRNDEAALMAYTAALIANFYSGRLLKARQIADGICERYDRQRHGKLVQIYQHDPKIVALVFLGHIEWLLGRPGKARDCCNAARQLARELGHPFMLAYALILGVSDHWYERDLVANLRCVEEGIKVAKDYGYPMYYVIGPLWAASALVARGPALPVLQQLCQLLTKLPAEDRCIQVPLYRIKLAEEFGRVGQIEKGRCLAASAEAVVKRTGERWYEPEVYRIRAGLACRGPHPDYLAAVDLFKRSLASAKSLKAIGWELRTSIDLARLLAGQGKRAQGRKLLAQVLRRFPAGEASVDIRDGSALLRELAVAVS